MAEYLVFDEAQHRIDEILDYSFHRWGEAQAVAYLDGLRAQFAAIAERRIPWRAISTDYGVDGFFARYQHHFVYWRVLAPDVIGIVTILHERMHQAAHLSEAFNDPA